MITDGTLRCPSAPIEPHAAFLQTKHFGSLDGIRCLCCLAVVKAHVSSTMGGPRLFDLGFLGVDMFFLISGFLIVTLLIRERERTGSISLKKFYIRRSLRIFPIYYLMIFLVVGGYFVISPWKPNGLRFYLPAVPVLLTYTMDFLRVQPGLFFPCWSLAMEEQFYQIWPAIEKFVVGKALWVVLAVSLAFNQAVNFRLFDPLINRIYGDPQAWLRPGFLITFTPILLGVTLAHALNSPRSFRWIYQFVGHRAASFVILGALLGFCELESGLLGLPRLVIHLLLAALLASLVIRENHYAQPILAFPWVARLGMVSYGMYLYHSFVIVPLEAICSRLGLHSPLTLFILASIATYLVAELSYRYVEAPLLRLKNRYGHVAASEQVAPSNALPAVDSALDHLLDRVSESSPIELRRLDQPGASMA